MGSARFLRAGNVEEGFDEVRPRHRSQATNPDKRLPRFTGKIEIDPGEIAFPREHWRFAARIDEGRTLEDTIGKMLAADIELHSAEGLVFNPDNGTVSGVIDFGPE